MKNNYYIDNVSKIARISIDRGVDWGVALSMFRHENEIPEDVNADASEFSDFVRGKIYDTNGEFVEYVKNFKV